MKLQDIQEATYYHNDPIVDWINTAMRSGSVVSRSVDENVHKTLNKNFGEANCEYYNEQEWSCIWKTDTHYIELLVSEDDVSLEVEPK